MLLAMSSQAFAQLVSNDYQGNLDFTLTLQDRMV